MKNYIKLICILCLLLMTPVYANTQYTLKVNDISYQLSTPLIERNDTLYMDLNELANILFTHVTVDQETYVLNFQDKTYELKGNVKTVSKGIEKYILSTPPVAIDNKVYVPIELFEIILGKDNLDIAQGNIQITCPTLFSRNSDSPEEHTYILSPYNLNNLPKHIMALSTEDTITNAINTAITNKDYISFLDNSNQTKVTDYLRSRLTFSPYNNIQVSYRIINTHTYPNQITDTVTLPLKIDFYGSTIRLKLGEDQWTYPTIWSTYYPKRSLADMDLQKSVDTTIMRALYEYYRNKHDLRDDKYFSPFTISSSNRTNEMLHDAYSISYRNDDTLKEYETSYTISIQRIHQSGKLHFVIDIISK